MFSKLLLVLGVAFAYGTGLTLKTTNKVSHTPNYSYRYDFIDYESPAYRLGDYDITELEHISAGGGQVRFFRVQVVLPRGVIDILGQSQNVFISMPLYDYNSAVDLEMKMEYYENGAFYSGLSFDYLWLPLSETMLKVLPYTMIDLSYDFNPFDYNNWSPLLDKEIRITFIIPYTEHTNAPSGWANEMRNITLFTARSTGEVGFYETGYDDGYNDGYSDGFSGGQDVGYNDGYDGGYLDGFENGYQVGFGDAETVGDGTWLGNLVFGTIGGIVGFLFALSDFEVLGVSIMSIITLFVAIGIVKLLLKVLK